MNRSVLVCLLILILCTCFAVDVFADSGGQKDFTTIVENTRNQVKSLGYFIKTLSGIIGVALVLFALKGFADLKKPGQSTPPMTFLLMLIFGFMLVSFTQFVGIGEKSIMGEKTKRSSEIFKQIGVGD